MTIKFAIRNPTREKGYGVPRSFLPKGRSGQVLYVVELIDHPGIVKIGMSRRWNKRRAKYTEWNFREGDGIGRETVFTISSEYCDLERLEAACLSAMKNAPFKGKEWFKADYDETVRLVDQVLCASGLDYFID